MMTDPKDSYAPFLSSTDVSTRTCAEKALRLKNDLDSLGIQLRWPEPPFDDRFQAQMQDELRFQIQWMIESLEMWGALSEDEQKTLTFPSMPFTETTVSLYVERHRQCVDQRPFWDIFRLGSTLSSAEQERQTLLQSLAESTWHTFSDDYAPLKLAFLSEMWNLTQVLVPKGVFRMGAVKGLQVASREEGPAHTVRIGHSLAVMPYLVTQALYQEHMKTNPSQFKDDDAPVESVSWFDALRFANVLSLQCQLEPVYHIDGEEVECDWTKDGWRLPTEAEWEYLAKGGESHLYAGSDAVDAVAWCEDNSGGETHPVGQKSANAFGLYDMSGNVWEWCWDWFGAYQQTSPHAPQQDPKGPLRGDQRVYRGGCWKNSSRFARVSSRFRGAPDSKSRILGFRLVRALF